MNADARPWGTTGAVQAEVFVLRMGASAPELAGPCGPEAWYLEVSEEEDPMEVVSRFSTRLLGAPLLVHSTSWRRDRGTVLLSFVVVLRDGQAAENAGVPIERAELARGTATESARAVRASQVIEHGLRHLAWLVQDDEAVREALPERWRSLLAGYVPEPFRHLS